MTFLLILVGLKNFYLLRIHTPLSCILFLSTLCLNFKKGWRKSLSQWRFLKVFCPDIYLFFSRLSSSFDYFCFLFCFVLFFACCKFLLKDFSKLLLTFFSNKTTPYLFLNSRNEKYFQFQAFTKHILEIESFSSLSLIKENNEHHEQ